MNAPTTRLILRSCGGFTGPAGAQTRTLDLAALPAAQARHFQQLLQACDSSALPARLTKAAPQPWDFEYSLEVQAGPASHTVQFHLDAAPPALRALASALDALPPD
ncbi:MAG: protealysin inhibitor emfourin [Sphingomonadaceae bacterium]